MRERITVRVLLFDREDRVLLMKGRLPNRPDHPGGWFTVGGGADPGESLVDCALREVREETGFTEIDLGPAVWLREGQGGLASGEVVVFKETYFVARCAGGEPSRAGWEAHEHELVDDLRWWGLDELAACTDLVFPERFVELAVEIIAGRYPSEPLDITLRP